MPDDTPVSALTTQVAINTSRIANLESNFNRVQTTTDETLRNIRIALEKLSDKLDKSRDESRDNIDALRSQIAEQSDKIALIDKGTAIETTRLSTDGAFNTTRRDRFDNAIATVIGGVIVAILGFLIARPH